MTSRMACVVVSMVALAAAIRAQTEVIAAIQVHGNTISTSEEILAIAGLMQGQPYSEPARADAERRLRSSRKFVAADVLKRYASISDPTQVTVLIQIDDGPVRIDVPVGDGPEGVPPAGRNPHVVRRGPVNVMFAPILTAEDGYGVTYGIRLALAGHRNTATRLVVPATWGGDRRVGAELQRDVPGRWLPDLRGGAFVQRRTHPFFDERADRTRVWGRGDWAVAPYLRTGLELAWQKTKLDGRDVEARSTAVDLAFDTRADPLMPRNAVLARTSVERLRFASSSATRSAIDVSGYLGIYRGLVLTLRAVREDASEPLPAFHKSVLGGSRNLRGFRAGHAIGDTLAAGSAELRLPVTSALHVAQTGVSGFFDVGTAYDKGQRLADRRFDRGVGGGVWLTAPLFRASLMVGRGLGTGTRAHVGVDLTF